MFSLFVSTAHAALGQGEPAQLWELETVFENAISAAIPLGGVIMLTMILYGGFLLITSGDNPDKVQAAKNTITYALIGLVLLASAYLIIVIIAEFTGVTALKNFTISQ